MTTRSRLLSPLVLVLVQVLAAGPALAASAGFAFLEIPTGARASALGGAYASLGQGVEAGGV